jgi:phage FluMu gp28-like protein
MTEAAPPVLLPYQQAWVADNADVKVCEKSRRVGLSWGEAEDSAESAGRSKDAGGMDTWYIGYNKDMAQEFIRDVAFWARAMNQACGEIGEEILKDQDKDILTFVIKFASGFRVTALSSRPSNLRGKQGRVIIDEAAFHENLPGLLKAAMALLMWGGKVRVISTHNGETNAFNELVLDIRAGKVPYSLHRIEFKEAIKQGLYKRICLATKKPWSPTAEVAWVKSMYDYYRDDAPEELDVIPSSGSGVYLTRALIEGVMRADIPVVSLAMPSSFAEQPTHIREAEIRDWCERELLPLLERLDPLRRSYLGEDFARSGDLTVLWPAQETLALGLDTPFVVELRNIPFEQQKQIVYYIIDRLPRFAAGAFDARGNGQYLAEVAMQKYGAARIAQVMLSIEWYREHMPRFKAAIEDKTINAPRDANILADLRAVKMEKGIAKVPDNARTRGADGQERHGDSAIACALMIYAAKAMEGYEIEFQSTGARRLGHTADLGEGPRRVADVGFGVVRGGNDFGGF